MNKILISAIAVAGLLLFILALFQTCFATPTSVVSVEPSYLKVSVGETFIVNITVYPGESEVFAASYTLYFDNTLLKAIGQTKGPFLSQDGAKTWELVNETNNTIGMVNYSECRKEVDYGVTTPDVLATITFQALADGISELCIGDLDGEILADPEPAPIPTNVTNGSVEIKPKPDIFDTRKPENPYPSIFGTHCGVIIPDQDIIVNKIYTYPCPGTGGHSESVIIWNETLEECTEAHWDGYTDDYHNLSFNRTITLKQGMIYNYTIETGSYPQIVHAKEYNATGGKITCGEFIDANGKTYYSWIPAIRLF